MRLRIERTWDGRLARAEEAVDLDLHLDDEALCIDFSATHHGDPPPEGPAGPTDRLWEHEVVELFVVGAGDRYTEIELGPAGHHLVLQLEGVRNVVASKLPLTYASRTHDGRWTGRAVIGRELLPELPWTLNAYAIHGQGGRRRYLALTPVPGPQPDYHRLHHFEVQVDAADLHPQER